MKAVWNTILIVFSSLFIIIVNALLKLLLRKLGKYERFYFFFFQYWMMLRYPSATKETGSSTKKIFYAMFFNSALIILIINGRIYDFIPSLEISKIIPALHDYMEEFFSNWIFNLFLNWCKEWRQISIWFYKKMVCRCRL